MCQPTKPLQEEDFIQESFQTKPSLFWKWSLFVLIISILIWTSNDWLTNLMENQINTHSFLQVTNRELSIFLWQFPEHMRVNSKTKNGYLTGFQYEGKIALYPTSADEFVSAPPNLLFLYHTWSRLIKKEMPIRPFFPKEFADFLEYEEAWQPKWWKEAPEEYSVLFFKLSNLDTNKDLSKLPHNILPYETKLAFQGWKNFFKEGEAINNTQPTYQVLDDFLNKFPHYKRNYWRNITNKISPNYLKDYTYAQPLTTGLLPRDQMSAFLKVALFNYMQKNYVDSRGTLINPSE